MALLFRASSSSSSRLPLRRRRQTMQHRRAVRRPLQSFASAAFALATVVAIILPITSRRPTSLFNVIVEAAEVVAADSRILPNVGNVNAKNATLSTDDTWYNDLLSLPPDVPWPGSAWLDRLATTRTTNAESTSTMKQFYWKNQTYSTVYAAFVHNDPLGMPCRNFNAYVNSVFISTDLAERLVHWTGSLDTAHYALCYLRNLIGAILVYYGFALTFSYFCYVHPSIAHATFEAQQRPRPTWSTMWNQIRLAQSSMFLYVLLPLADEFAVEQGWTATYFTISQVGGYGYYLLTMLFYFSIVEIGIYWMHRTLHTNKWLYKHIHLLHHQYNKPELLTPWASIAFHPLDGLLQASPYFFTMFVVPSHYLTRVGLLFFTEVWATYIHDAMDWNVHPIMGSKYHTVHHTHYVYNYGQVFIFCDYLFGTLRVPLELTGGTEKQRLKKLD